MANEPAEHQRLTETLRRQSALLEKVQHLAQIGGWELNLRTHELTWTPETYRIHGVTPATFNPTVDTAIGFYTRETQPTIRRALKAAADSALHYDLELQILRADGTLRWVRSVGRRADEEGEPQIVCGVIQDITERRALEEEIVSIAQREQTRIGLDLHDGLGQELTGISLVLGSVVPKLPPDAAAFRDVLRAVEKQVQDSIETCRTLAQGLSPTARKRGGLIVALQDLASRLEKLHSLPIRVRTRGQNGSLEDTITDHLYRIAQEAVTNALKHGSPTRITIAFESSSKRSVVSVTNDSQTPSEKPAQETGMGLKIMRYRARLIGGTLTIRPLKSGGMRVRCCIASSL